MFVARYIIIATSEAALPPTNASVACKARFRWNLTHRSTHSAPLHV